MSRPRLDRATKRTRELEASELRAAKIARRQSRREAKEQGVDYREQHIGHPATIDPTEGMAAPEQFPSAWPQAPEPVAGVARTLSRGLPDAAE